MGNVFTKLYVERSEEFTKNTCIAQCLYDILADDPEPNVLKDLIWSSESPKCKILREIFFETGIEEVALLEDRIYQYGSMIKEQDYISREIFLGMIALLGQLKK